MAYSQSLRVCISFAGPKRAIESGEPIVNVTKGQDSNLFLGRFESITPQVVHFSSNYIHKKELIDNKKQKNSEESQGKI